MRFFNIIVAIVFLSACSGTAFNTENVPDNPTGATIVNASEEGGANKTEAEYSTKYDEKSGGRAHNIKLAANKINGITVAPGEVFSYNDTLGPTGKKNGYKKARIFVRGQDAEGYGGGVCQVSSTLYNCALEMNLDIVERHPHSKPVGYVPEDKDAATSYGGKDFKFENTLSSPLKITASAVDGVLKISLES